jgi:hypothetical protein
MVWFLRPKPLIDHASDPLRKRGNLRLEPRCSVACVTSGKLLLRRNINIFLAYHCPATQETVLRALRTPLSVPVFLVIYSVRSSSSRDRCPIIRQVPDNWSELEVCRISSLLTHGYTRSCNIHLFFHNCLVCTE